MQIKFRHTVAGVCLATLLLAVASCGSSRQTSRGKHDTGRPSGSTSRPAKRPTPDAPSGQLARALVDEARTWLGVPYVMGGADRKGADCSGFLVSVYRDVADIKLPRTTSQQREHCIPIEKDQLAAGDILFFSSKRSGGKVAHVAMYIGNGRMIHASSSRGVVEDDIALKYYLDHYLGSGRIPALAQALPLPRPTAPASPAPTPAAPAPSPAATAPASPTPAAPSSPNLAADSTSTATITPITPTTPTITSTITPADTTSTTQAINSRVRNAFNKTTK